MGTVKKNWERMFAMSPYFVQTRAFERRLLKEAFAAAKKPAQVAAMLGVSQRFLQLRMRYLGGIEPGSVPIEPPQVADEAARQRGLAAAAAANLARKARKAAAAAGEQVAPSVAPAPILTAAALASTTEAPDDADVPDDAELTDAEDEDEDDSEESDDPLVAALYD